MDATECKVHLQPVDIERIAILCGSNNENIRHLAKRLNVDIHHKGHMFQISGQGQQPESAKKVILNLYEETLGKNSLSLEDIHLKLQTSSLEDIMQEKQPVSKKNNNSQLITPQQIIQTKGKNQREYLAAMEHNNVQFAVGPAGTGKTFLAVAYAVHILKQKQVERICLARPAVEAGETLGFLPGTLIEKINPYLQPLYDALYSTLGVDTTSDLIKNNTIEISALAYMRGRTLSNCIVILDEGQNTSREQMKMFLTRLGYNSQAVITGDLTQVDLPSKVPSGMAHAIDILQGIEGIGISRLTTKDVVRHPIVTDIIEAYDKAKS
ncbi:MAG: PhoH family protein [Candidatus Portiera sp.]|nr:PhoH family protein [Portiera sp.]